MKKPKFIKPLDATPELELKMAQIMRDYADRIQSAMEQIVEGGTMNIIGASTFTAGVAAGVMIALHSELAKKKVIVP